MNELKKQEFYNQLNISELEMVETLGKLIHRINPKTVLEIGSGWGVSARIILENSDAHLTTIDKTQDLLKFDLFTKGFESRITRITGSSQDILPTLKGRFDVIYVDGSHVYEEVKKDLEEAMRLSDIIICDDALHIKNWMGEYGVTRAIAETFHGVSEKVTFYLSAHGIALIEL